MTGALLIAAALLGQADYNLIDPVTGTRATVRTAHGAYADDKVSALADARAKIRAYSRALSDARAEARELAQDIAGDPPTLPEVDDTPPVARVRRASTTTAPRAATQLIRSDPAYSTGESCYSSTASAGYSSAPVTYSTGPPVAYSTGPPVTYVTAPPVTYSEAAPVTYAASAPAFAPVASSYRARTRMGIFGGFRQNIRATSSGYGAAPMAFGSGFFAASGAACASGSCP